jgi:peptide/nickel transport system ATP-binding protein
VSSTAATPAAHVPAPAPPSLGAPPLLALDKLHLTLASPRGPLPALRGLSLRLGRGQTLGLVGESGCGKSLTALAIMGLLPESAQLSGAILFDGLALPSLGDQAMGRVRGARIGMVFQEPMTALNPLHRIGRQIAEPLRLHRGMDSASARAEALRLLERVKMPQAAARLDTYPHQLSGGQRQRVVIAMALACGPQLLVADEPTTALDATTQREVLDLIDELVADSGMALLLISHDLGLMADRVEQLAVMYAGQVVEQGATAEVFARPQHPYTQGLLAARPRLGLARGTRLATIPGRVPDLLALPPGCSFAPRCPRADAACQGLPALRASAQGQGHGVACWHPGGPSDAAAAPTGAAP